MTSLVVQTLKRLSTMWETWVWSLGWEDPWRRERLPTPVFWPGDVHGLLIPWGHKELHTNERLSLSWYIINLIYMCILEKALVTHSSTLAWKLPWTEETGRLQSMGLLRVGHDWVTSLSLFTFMHWRRKWQPTPVFLPGESQGRGAWRAAIYGVTQSQTWLKRLSSSSIIKVWNISITPKCSDMFPSLTLSLNQLLIDFLSRIHHSIRSLVDPHLGCFQFLVLVNNVYNIFIEVFMGMHVFD